MVKRPLHRPDLQLRDLPERAVQFGTGALLRGLVGHLLDESNKAGKFNGRVMAIGSTGSGRDRLINSQNGLFTLLTEGMERGEAVRKYEVVSSLSRALSAVDEWQEALALARSPELEVVFSNTTEVGIGLESDDGPELSPPKSFPAKLTRFLFERACAFDYDESKGLIVLPCELIERNGDTLRALVIETAREWTLGEKFLKWMERSVSFGNTLVDRIVSGTPPAARMPEIESELEYVDELVTVCEPYRLFAIEGDARIREWVGRCSTDPGFFATDDIEPYCERKVRILNGAHTVMVPAALLAGCETVYDAMSDRQLGGFVRTAILEEIVPTLAVPGAEQFAREVLERLANPFIQHALIDITLHGTAKMRVRVVPTILDYAAKEGRPPANLTFGFAAHLVFMRGDLHVARGAAHLAVPIDGAAERIRSAWRSKNDVGTTVADLCADRELWGADLSSVPDFVRMVTGYAAAIARDGVRAALYRVNSSEKAAVS
jgi:tagaturonate reductase